MTTTPDAPRRSRRALSHAFGFPDIRGRGRLVLALGVDALGSGFFLPFAFVYFLTTTDISLVGVGSALSAGALVAAPFALVAGAAVDRQGPRPVMLASHALRAMAFLAFPLAQQWWHVLVLTAVVGIGDQSFWPANSTLVARIAPREIGRWFSLERALRNGGIAVGGAVGSVIVARDSAWAPTAVVVANAVTFAVAGLLIAALPLPAPPPRCPEEPHDATPRRVYLRVLADRAFMAVVASTVVIGLTDFVLILIVAATFVSSSTVEWLPGALLSLNALGVTLLQPPLARATERTARTRAMQAAAGVYCLSFLGLIAARHSDNAPVVVTVAFASVAVFTFAELVQAPAGYGLAVAITPEPARGRYLAVYHLSWTVAAVVGPAVFAFLLDLHPDLPLLALTVAFGAVAAVMSWLHRTLPPAALTVTQ